MPALMTEGPQIPLLQYQPDQPPVVPSIKAHFTVANLLPRIVSALINEMGNKAYANAARMHCYNVMCQNYWQNPNFQELVQFAADYLALRGVKGELHSLENGVYETASLAANMATGNMICTIPELRSRISQDQVAAALNNSSIYTNLISEITNMNGFPPNNSGMVIIGYHPNGQPIYGHAGMMPQGYGGSVPVQMMPPVGYGGYPQHQMPQQVPAPVQQPVVMAPGFRNTVFANASPPGVGGIDRGDGGAVNDRYASRPQSELPPSAQAVTVTPNQQQGSYRQAPQSQPQSPQTGSRSESYVTTLGGSEMDRAKHRISYFQHQAPVDVEGEKNVFEALATNTSEDAATAVSFLKREWGMGVSQRELEISIRINMLKHQRDTKAALAVFREYGMRFDPIISLVSDVVSYADTIAAERKNYRKLIELVNAITKTITTDEKTSKSRGYVSDVMTMILIIDRYFTTNVNLYLKGALRSTIQISSFFEDGLGIVDFIANKQDSTRDHAVALEEYIANIVENYLSPVDQDLTDIIKNNTGFEEGLFGFFPASSVCVTFIDMNTNELGLGTGTEPERIDLISTPALYKLVKNQEDDDKKISTTPAESYLLTKDGQRYRIFPDAVNSRAFYLIKT